MLTLFVDGAVWIMNLYDCVSGTLPARFRRRFRNVARLESGESGAADSRPLEPRKEYRTDFGRPSAVPSIELGICVMSFDLDLWRLRYRCQSSGGPTQRHN